VEKSFSLIFQTMLHTLYRVIMHFMELK